MIDEKVLIERLEEEQEGYSDTTYYALGIGFAIKIVNKLASEHNNGWISVEDALPEEYMDVLGYGQEGHTYIVRLYESKIFGKVWKQWNGGDMRFDWIVAWQPLPAPYKKGE